MKTILCLITLIATFLGASAHADFISIACGKHHNDYNPQRHPQLLFSADEITLSSGTSWGLEINGKEVKTPKRAVFRETQKEWVYIVTEAPRKGKYLQYVFKITGSCQDEGDQGYVTVRKISRSKAESQIVATKKFACSCTSD